MAKTQANSSAPPADSAANDHRTDRQVDAGLAAMHELCGLLLATRRNNGRRTAHNFGVDFTQGADPIVAALTTFAKDMGFVTSIDQAAPHSLAVSC